MKHFLACSLLLLLSLSMTAKTKTVQLRVIETTDVHGHFFPYSFMERKPLKGSLARVSTYVNRLRKEYGKNVILIDNGDILQGQPICYYYNCIKTDEPNIAASVINYMGYDAQTFGNHDVETGHAVYDKWIREVNCPMLGANIIDTKTNKPYVAPYTILEREGVKIAILGMITPAIPYWLNESIWSGLRFEEMTACARYWMDYLQKNEKPDVVIGMFHSGWDGGIANPDYLENASERVAKEVPGFDLIFLGHDHTEHNSTETNALGQKVVCLDPANHALKVAEAQITITLKGKKVVKKEIIGNIVDVSNEEIDEAMVQRFQPEVDQVKEYVGKRIGYFEAPVYTKDCFFGNAAFADLIHNLQLQITGADISFNAPLTFDAVIPQGDVCISDMFKLYRFENLTYVVMMTGEEVRKHLEMSYDQWVNTMTSPDDHIMLINERDRNGTTQYVFQNFTFNFDSAAGIDYEVDVTKPNGQKVRILRMSNGEPFDESKWYRVVMNSYRGNGGGELLTQGAGIPKDELINKRIVFKSERDQRYYLIQEIEKMGKVFPRANNNWRFVPEDWSKPALERDRQLIFPNKR